MMRKIASAIVHLHKHDPHNPAYHRDIKAANVALTATLQPKLIDCGLGKYAPAARDAGRSAFTRADQRLGTPVYMCPEYATDGPYDARSEIYSFGILMAELLTGQLQQAGDLKHSRNVDRFPPDPLAELGPVKWPAACVRDLRALEKECMRADPVERPREMMAVLRRLIDIERTHCAHEDAARLEREEATARRAADADAREQYEQSAQAAARAAARRECASCGDECAVDGGVECASQPGVGRGGGRHFQCDECFELGVASQVADQPAFVRNQTAIVCAFCPFGHRAVFGEQLVAEHVTRATWAALSRAKIDNAVASAVFQAEQRIQERLDRVRLEAAADASQERVRQHRLQLTNLMNVVCPNPRCGGAIIFNWAACFNITCGDDNGRFGCGTVFCAWCLHAPSSHDHVKNCAHNRTQPRGIYGNQALWTEAHRAQRIAKVKAYFVASVAAADVAAVLTATERDLAESMWHIGVARDLPLAELTRRQ